MRFEEFASKAGKSAARVGSRAERPAFSQILVTRRRRTLVSAWSTAAIVALAIFGIVFIWPGPGASVPPAAAPTTTTTTASTSSTLEDTGPGALAGVPESCPITVPGDNAFTPASEAPEGPPSVYEVVWYGTPQLWTMINPQGEINSKRWLHGDRTFWWSENYSPADPAEFTVTAEYLNGSAPTVEVSKPGGSGFNPFMLMPTHESVTMVGIELPEPGCWELTADYKGATLSYVVWVSDD